VWGFVVHHDIILTLILFSLQHYFICSLGKVMGGKVASPLNHVYTDELKSIFDERVSNTKKTSYGCR
ncbi:MAG: hypothetical protein D3908_16905, partial [Candidatus Electrothrix sp. AUS4]|nr:hypothetical protein [Candidatus Electrothrix sp. AUS4]